MGLWFCDIRHPEERKLAGRVNLLALTPGGSIPAYCKAWGLTSDQCVWMPQACLPNDTPPPEYKAWPHDLLFIGTDVAPEWHRDRRVMINNLLKEYGEGRFRWLDPMTDLEKLKVTEHMTETYRQSKVAWGHSTFDCFGYHSNRIFLAIGCGGFYLCNEYPGMHNVFTPGEHLGTYDPLAPWSEQKAVIDYWIENDDARETIRQQGFAYAQANHTYLNRIPELWACIEKRM